MIRLAWVCLILGCSFNRGLADSSAKAEALGTWRAGTPADVELLFLNDSNSPVDPKIPMSVEVSQAGNPEAVSFEQVAPSVLSGQALGAFQFRKVLYRGTIPRSWGGALVLKIKAGSQTLTLVAVVEPEISQTAQPGWFGRQLGVDWNEQRNPSSPVAEFLTNHFTSHEPVYFVAGGDSPNIRFQISLRYRLVSADSNFGQTHPWTTGFHVAYTQISLWDIKGDSAPFLDSSYKPEVQYGVERLLTNYLPSTIFLGVRMGVQHESNGKAGLDSRGLNLVYIKPVLTIGDPNDLHFTLEPKILSYISDMPDNPDIAYYRGNVDLRAIFGWKQGFQISALGRVGSHFNRGSVLLDLTYPLAVINGGFGAYLDLQYFDGYGETLLNYNQRNSALRLGLSLIR